MEAFTRRCTFQVRNLDRPQELGIFYEGIEVESETSSMGFISV